MTNELRQIGRMSFRVEGRMWRCYWCPNEHNMKGKVELGGIAMVSVEEASNRAAFKDLMKECFADVCEERMGIRPVFKDERIAPEHERSGSA